MIWPFLLLPMTREGRDFEIFYNPLASRISLCDSSGRLTFELLNLSLLTSDWMVSIFSLIWLL